MTTYAVEGKKKKNSAGFCFAYLLTKKEGNACSPLGN